MSFLNAETINFYHGWSLQKRYRSTPLFLHFSTPLRKYTIDVPLGCELTFLTSMRVSIVKKMEVNANLVKPNWSSRTNRESPKFHSPGHKIVSTNQLNRERHARVYIIDYVHPRVSRLPRVVQREWTKRQSCLCHFLLFRVSISSSCFFNVNFLFYRLGRLARPSISIIKGGSTIHEAYFMVKYLAKKLKVSKSRLRHLSKLNLIPSRDLRVVDLSQSLYAYRYGLR